MEISVTKKKQKRLLFDCNFKIGSSNGFAVATPYTVTTYCIL